MLALVVAAPAATIATNDITAALGLDFLFDNVTEDGNDNIAAVFVPKLGCATSVNGLHQTDGQSLFESLGGGLFHFSPLMIFCNLNRLFRVTLIKP